MMSKATSPNPAIDIEALGFDAGAHLLVKQALAPLPVGGTLGVRGSSPGWAIQLADWCRAQGHGFAPPAEARGEARITRGGLQSGRWRGAEPTGAIDPHQAGAVADEARLRWGLAARGATVEAGSPAYAFRLVHKDEAWSDSAAELYAQAVAAQWNPDEAIDWSRPVALPEPVEQAIVQVMTYMIENENVALLVPARFLGQLHPHFREVQAALAMQVCDEARHIEVFTRRIRHGGHEPALSTAGGQASLKSLLEEPDFSVASFLLSVLGEGTFVNLLQFLQAQAPDPLTRQIARLAARDEARHVALGMSHLLYRLEREPDFRHRLAGAVEQRFDALAGTAGLNEEVFDALILIGAGGLAPAQVAQGYGRVQQLMREMADGRCAKLVRLGFPVAQAAHLASLHTRNFM